MASALAERGYWTLALNRRDHDGGFITGDFAGSVGDLNAAIAFLASRGRGRVVLVGDQLGAAFASAYAAESTEASVSAVILTGDLAGVSASTKARLAAEELTRVQSWAEGASADGRARELTIVREKSGAQFVTSAQAFLAFHSAASKAVVRAHIPRVRVPVLLLHESSKPGMEVARQLAAAAIASPGAQAIEVKTTGQAVEAMTKWLDGLGAQRAAPAAPR
jgi:type IV secretory pathway VirJ component